MKRDEADRRIKALGDFHAAVGAVLEETLTGVTVDGTPVSLGVPKPGRQAEWAAARANADLLAMPAARAFQAAGTVLNYKPAGTWDTQPVNPALAWHEILEQDSWYPASMLDQMTNRAIGRLQDLRDDPPSEARRGVFIPFPSWGSLSKAGRWVAGAVGAILIAVAAGGILFWLGWV